MAVGEAPGNPARELVGEEAEVDEPARCGELRHWSRQIVAAQVHVDERRERGELQRDCPGEHVDAEVEVLEDRRARAGDITGECVVAEVDLPKLGRGEELQGNSTGEEISAEE